MSKTLAIKSCCFVALVTASVSVAGTALGQPPQPPGGVAFAAGFQPGSQQLFALDLNRTPIGEFPADLEFSTGIMEVVLKNGVRMLKASARSAFVIPLAQVLPRDFTVEFDLIPKGCCNEPDLSFEGTPTIDQGVASAHILWQAEGISNLVVIGGASDNYESPIPENLRVTLPGVLTKVAVSFEGSTVKLYTNGRRMFTLDRQFARLDVLRVFLGGVDDLNAVYLAGLRIATGAPLAGIAQTPGQPGQPGRPGQQTGTPAPPSSRGMPQPVIPRPSVPPPPGAGTSTAVPPPPPPIVTRPGAASGPVTTTVSSARCTPGAPTAPPPQQFTPFGIRVGGAPLQWISEPNTQYVVERAPAPGGATVLWTQLASTCDATPSLVAGSWVSEDLNTYPTLGLVDVYPGVQLGSGYQYRLTRIQADGSSGSSIVYWQAPTGSFQANPGAAVNGHIVTITTGVSYCQPLGLRCDPWMLEFTVSRSSSGYNYSTQQTWVDNSNPAVPGSEPGTFAFAILGVPSGSHTFSVTALYQPTHRVSAGSVTVLVP